MIINGARMTPADFSQHHSLKSVPSNPSTVKNVQFVRTHSNSPAGSQQKEAGGESSDTETEKVKPEKEELYTKGKHNMDCIAGTVISILNWFSACRNRKLTFTYN